MNSKAVISVFGAGYVGCVSAACLSRDGHYVVAVDPDEAKVKALSQGIAPIFEPGLAELVSQGRQSGHLVATIDYISAVHGSDISFCCPGTPSREDGSLDTRYVEKVSEQIGEALRDKSSFHLVVMRSTILPGTMESVVIPALERGSGKRAGVDFGVAYYPEFLREGTAIDDYYAPGAIVFGQYDGDVRSIAMLADLCAHIPVKPHVINIRSAELVKYANNCWHAVKISFANEIGNLAKLANIDSHQVMDVVCSDKRLNMSPAYLKPGYAFGGSCLPKDLRALRSFGRSRNQVTPLLDATMMVNDQQIERAYHLVRRSGNQKIGMLGITFKSDTDDLRESPYVALAERLLGSGFELSIYDPNVSSSRHGGRSFIPHLAPFVRSSAHEVVQASETIVIGSKSEQNKVAFDNISERRVVIDLARLPISRGANIEYVGLAW